MLRHIFTLWQLLFGLSLAQVHVVLSLIGQSTPKTMVILVFIFLSGFALSLSLNDNLLKSRVLSLQITQMDWDKEDKNHFLFLIQERSQRTTRTVLTELLLFIMVVVYCSMANMTGLSLLVVVFAIHAMFVLGISIVHLMKDRANRKMIQQVCV